MIQSSSIHWLKKEIKENLTLSIPLITAQLIYSCSSFIGTAMIAKLGEAALAAGVLVSTIWMSLSVLFFGMLNSISVLVAHQYSIRDEKKISEIMGQSFLLGIILSILLILILFFMPLFLKFTSQPPHVLQLAIAYMHALIWTVPGLLALIIIEQFLSGINRTRLVLRISILVVPVEIPIIYALIFGKFGLPAFGVAGIGYGFAITYTSTAIILITYLLHSKYYNRFKILKDIMQLKYYLLKELIAIGVPMGFMHVIEVSTFAIMTYWIAQFGTTILAAHQIALQFLGFFITIVFAMSQAVTIRVGYAVGKNNLRGIYDAVHTGLLLNSLCMFLIMLAFYFFPHIFLKIDIDINNPANVQLVKDSTHLLTICGLLMFFDNFRIIGFGALRGIKDTKFPMYASLISFWLIGLSSAYLLGFHLRLQGPGIWWGATIGISVGMTMVLIRLYKNLKTIDLKKTILIT